MATVKANTMGKSIPGNLAMIVQLVAIGSMAIPQPRTGLTSIGHFAREATDT